MVEARIDGAGVARRTTSDVLTPLGEPCRTCAARACGPWIRQTGLMDSAFAMAANALDEETFQALYGRWVPLEPGPVAELFAGSVRWWVVGGRAARIGAPPRPHDDTDVAVSRSDLDELRKALSGWHLWEANDGTLRPVLPGQPLTAGCEQLGCAVTPSIPGGWTSSSIQRRGVGVQT